MAASRKLDRGSPANKRLLALLSSRSSEIGSGVDVRARGAFTSTMTSIRDRVWSQFRTRDVEERELWTARLRPVFDYIHGILAASPGRFDTFSAWRDTPRHIPVTDANNLPIDTDNGARFERMFVDCVSRTERAIAAHKTEVAWLPNVDEHFRPGWEDRIRRTAYFSFVNHYGQDRDGEIDKHGHPLPYDRHPFGVAFDDLRRIGFLTEDTTKGALLHDVKEDVNKGFFVSGMRVPASEVLQHIDRFLSSSAVADEGGLDLVKLVGYVNKHHLSALARFPISGKADSIIQRFDTLSREDPETYLKYAPHVFAMTFADRTNNARTFFALNHSRAATLWAMTSTVMLPLAQLLHMGEGEELLLDMLDNVRPRERDAHLDRMRVLEQRHRLPDAFIKDFYAELERHGYSSEDVHLVIRPRSMRHRSDAELSVIMDRMVDPHAQGRLLNSILSAVVTTGNSATQEELMDHVLPNIFRKFFPHVITKPLFPEQRDHSEKRGFASSYSPLTFACDDPSLVGPENVDTPPGHFARRKGRYGVTAYRVATISEHFRHVGDIHNYVFSHDSSARANLLAVRDVLRTAAGTCASLSRRIHERTLPEDDEDLSAVAPAVDAREQVSLQLPWLVSYFTPEEGRALREITRLLFYLFFHGYGQVHLVPKRDSDISHAASYGPTAAPVVASAFITDPGAVLRNPLYMRLDMGLEQLLSRGFVPPAWDAQQEHSTDALRRVALTPIGRGVQQFFVELGEKRDPLLANLLLESLSSILADCLRVVARDAGIDDVPSEVFEALHARISKLA